MTVRSPSGKVDQICHCSGGGKEGLGEGKWISLNTLNLGKTKIWKDYFASLELKKGKGGGGCVFWNGGEEGLYSSGEENMNKKSFNESWQKIMNLNLILAFGEIECIKCRDWWE